MNDLDSAQVTLPQIVRRKTRFVCVSDTHGYTPSGAGFKLPAGDVLIHAGDLTNKGGLSELRRTMDWISETDFEVKIVVAGNHDITLDPAFYSEHGSAFHGTQLVDVTKCMEIFAGASPSVVVLQHEATVVHLSSPTGPQTSFKVFGSPYSQFEGNWAFGYPSDKIKDAESLWSQIPEDADIIVTHTPPQSHCDRKPTGINVGCEVLRRTLSRIRPPLAVCGHVHEGRGYERVRWPATLPTAGFENTQVNDAGNITQGPLPPPGSKKQSLVDLTGRRGPRLDNDGFSCRSLAASTMLEHDQGDSSDSPRISYLGGCNFVDGAKGLDISLSSLRRETCIVNAAITATSWPHRGGKRFNPPIVVDLELPVRQGEHASRC
ncbi:hypothetical protein N7468_001489 [Penicillium chermesinum]|uniref:Calcineurin-like phosphoesterase domain-containing protein n=1 Tax=Penicillium chermesinum TaxID=63820 RepID=A0A9W9PIF3_9EURO|nr:uncharacterized protein N7468_001489 [Penicillium chermesinum]KAJ5246506.1 hypothetical protein N7468_001489 [Penicillium chermesinum]KAJ6144775.1 hypothetical protein N7470_008670 [Penicillium chermesinum]